MTYKTLTVPLAEKEWHTLQTIAQSEYRNPKQQAAYLLSCALEVDSPQENINPIYQTGFKQKEAIQK
tara:strand:- start:966 stop:1166 length:201 start_codon:yes stop_codon:yes gene_type:complete